MVHEYHPHLCKCLHRSVKHLLSSQRQATFLHQKRPEFPRNKFIIFY